MKICNLIVKHCFLLGFFSKLINIHVVVSSRPALPRPTLAAEHFLVIFWWPLLELQNGQPENAETHKNKPFFDVFRAGACNTKSIILVQKRVSLQWGCFFRNPQGAKCGEKTSFFAFHSGFFLKICRLIVKHGVLLVDFQQNCENKVFLSTAVRVQNTFSCSAGVLFFEFVVQQKQQLIAA